VAVSIEAVSKWYRSRVLALQEVSISIPTGARVGLLGPNGAGKSTVVKLLQGSLRPTLGRVRVLGVTADEAGFIDVRRRMGVVPQSAGVYTDLTAWQYLDLAREAYGCRDFAGVTEQFGFHSHLQKPMAQLSGGLQRRVSLAAAFISEPELLVLDEPSLGLDPVAAQEMHDSLRELSAGRTVLVCTNNIAEAEALCDHVVIINEGRVVLQGRLDALLAGRRQVLIRVRQADSKLVRLLKAAGVAATADDQGVVVDVGADEGYESAVPKLLRSILDAGLDVVECRPLESMLKAAFFEAVQGSGR